MRVCEHESSCLPIVKIKMRKKAQIWVETVIYTLIGLAILGLVLGLVKPKIDELKDKSVIDQSINILNRIDETISFIKYPAGNSRPAEIKIQKGTLKINSEQNYIEYILEKSNYKYSEPDEIVEIGSIKLTTTPNVKTYDIKLKLDYNGIVDITWEGGNREKILQPAPSPYSLIIANKGFDEEGIPNIDFS